MTSDGGYHQNAGAGTFGGCNQTAPANFTVGAVGFGPAWSDGLYEEAREVGVCTACGMTDSMAESIVMLLTKLAEVESERDFYKAAAGKLAKGGRKK